MEANEFVLTYMSDNKRRRQVASDIKIGFPEGTQTTLTIERLTFVKDSVTTSHPNSHRSAPITALGLVFFFRKGRISKDFGFPVAVKTGEGVITAAVLPTSDDYLENNPQPSESYFPYLEWVSASQ